MRAVAACLLVAAGACTSLKPNDVDDGGSSLADATASDAGDAASCIVSGAWHAYGPYFRSGIPSFDGTVPDAGPAHRSVAVGGRTVWFRGVLPYPGGAAGDHYVYATDLASGSVTTMSVGAEQIAALTTGAGLVAGGACLATGSNVSLQHGSGTTFDSQAGCVAEGAALAPDSQGIVWGLSRDTLCSGHHCVFKGQWNGAQPLAWSPVTGQPADMIAADPSAPSDQPGRPWIVVGAKAMLRFNGHDVDAGAAFESVDTSSLPVDSIVSLAANGGSLYVAGRAAGRYGVFRSSRCTAGTWDALTDSTREYVNIAAYGEGIIAIATDGSAWYWVDR